MKRYYTIEDLAHDDSNWRKLAFIISKNHETADELLHIFYEKIIERFKSADSKNFFVNKNYVYTALQNSLRTMQKKDSKYIEVQDTHAVVGDDYDLHSDIINQSFAEELLSQTDELSWFDRKLFMIIVYDGQISMRELARKSGISYNTIQKSVVITKEYLKNKNIELWEELEKRKK